MNDPSKAIIKRLKKELDAAKDPQTVISVTRMMEQVFARLEKQDRKSKPVEMKAPAPKKPKPTRAGSMVDNLSEEERPIHDVVVRAEQIILEAKRQGMPVPTDKEAVDRAISELTQAS